MKICFLSSPKDLALMEEEFMVFYYFIQVWKGRGSETNVCMPWQFSIFSRVCQACRRWRCRPPHLGIL
ncbi:hypothetical protein Pint_34174 [Pistacia integerrima]|uniref:Uncharacterized protein n=1 Tax=Pistacia integerrima TaxID=434235 RepID=A0ACC0X7C4_9ROSI|nr:hypothetical protein Pint_34174 [Pistacia integerrima]